MNCVKITNHNGIFSEKHHLSSLETLMKTGVPGKNSRSQGHGRRCISNSAPTFNFFLTKKSGLRPKTESAKNIEADCPKIRKSSRPE